MLPFLKKMFKKISYNCYFKRTMSIHAGLEYVPGKYDIGRGSTKMYSLKLNESNLRDETLTHISAS